MTLEHRILRYADQVEKRGYWLDSLDACLCAQKMKATVALYVPVPGKDMEWINVRRHLDESLSEQPLEPAPPLDLADKKTWLLFSCNANFRTNGFQNNHWIPCVHKSQVEDAVWTELTVEARRAAMKEISEIQRLIGQNEISENPDPAIRESLDMERQKPLDCSPAGGHMFAHTEPITTLYV